MKPKEVLSIEPIFIGSKQIAQVEVGSEVVPTWYHISRIGNEQRVFINFDGDRVNERNIGFVRHALRQSLRKSR
jgi:hypothetical protein